jgi:hypothetical protein
MVMAAAGLALVPAMATCGDSPTGPEGGELAVLESVGGELLPASVEEAPGFERTYLADSIRLGANGQWTRIQIQRLATPQETPDPVRWESRGRIERLGDTLVLDFECDDVAVCIPPDRLIPTEEGFRTERTATSDPASVLLFRRESWGGAG